jgi:hypothetical protein
MKTELFKKLIKEAVREVLREELAGVQTQVPKRQISQITKYETYTPPVQKPARYAPTGDPIADLLNETKAQMVGGDYRTAYSATSDMVSAPGLGANPILMEDSFARPEPGLDISQFDFVNKAAAVFKASQEKDKQRFGG